MLKKFLQSVIDPRIRTGLWALRTRRDTSVIKAVVREILNIPYPISDYSDHLKATMVWLCAAQDAYKDGGVAAFYDLRDGAWGPLYPETTGYIIPTFFDYAHLTKEEQYRQRAIRMADWLLTVQLESGAFPIGPLWEGWRREPIIFDTGQILEGLSRVAVETGSQRYLDAAIKAGDWLIEVQDQDGCWRKFTSLDLVHTYNVRAAWALLKLYEATQEERFKASAIANLDWALTQQQADGWYANNSFRLNEDPLTHTIAYSIEGILRAGLFLQDTRFIGSARLAADALIVKQIEDGYLKGRYGPGWQSNDHWSCLTGNAQMAMVWFILYESTGDKKYFDAANNANAYLKKVHDRSTKHAGISGGVWGSYPIEQEYEPYRLLNWAAKFFADSLLLEGLLKPKG